MHIYSNWHNETLVSVMGFGHYCFTNRKYSVLIVGLAGIRPFGKIRIRIFLHPFGLDEVPWLPNTDIFAAQSLLVWLCRRGVVLQHHSAQKTR